MNGDSRIGGPTGQPYFPGETNSVENTLLDKLHAQPPYDNFQLTTDFFNSLSPSDAKDLFNQLNVFNDLSSQFNSQFDGPGRAQLLNILQAKFEPPLQSSPDSAPQPLDPKAGGSLRQELGILGSVREAQVSALFDDKVSAAPTGAGGTGGVLKTFKTRDEAIAFAGANSKDTAVFEDQNHQWLASHPDKDKWLEGRNEIHEIWQKMTDGTISSADGQAKLNEAYVKTLAASLGVSPADINLVGPNNPADPNKINFDPALKGKEGTAGAAKLDGNPKSIVIGPDAIKLDNPFDTIDTVAHEASHVRLAADGNKLLAQWQNIKGKKPDFPKWLESEYKQKHISAEQLVTTASAYQGGRNPSEAISYINGFIASFAKDRASFQKAQNLPPDDRLVSSDLGQAASFSPESSNLTTQEDADLKKALMGKLEDFYKTLDASDRQRFDQAMQKAIKDHPNSWLAAFKHTK